MKLYHEIYTILFFLYHDIETTWWESHDNVMRGVNMRTKSENTSDMVVI